jgi:hypothetical protein
MMRYAFEPDASRADVDALVPKLVGLAKRTEPN